MSNQKNWTWTLNNPTEEEVVKLKLDHDGISYIVWQEETAPTTGTHHLQGFVQFVQKKRLEPAKKIMGPRVSLRASKGSAEQNLAYCTKQGGWNSYEWGSITLKGERNDVQAMNDVIDESDSWGEVFSSFDP